MCTTELGAFAKLEPEFTKRGVKLIGLSANTIDSHSGESRCSSTCIISPVPHTIGFD